MNLRARAAAGCGVAALIALAVGASSPTRAAITAPGGVDSGLVLWLDASNPNGDDTTPAEGSDITTWVDLSPAGNDATVNPDGAGVAHTAADFEAAPSGFNGKAALLFTRVDDDSGSAYEVAGLDIRPATRPDVTVFTVYRPTAVSTANSPWGSDNGTWDRFFIAYHGAFGDGVDDGVVGLGPSSGGETIENSGVTTAAHLMTIAYDGEVTNGTNSGPTDASFVSFNCTIERTFADSTDDTDAKDAFSVGWDGDNSAFQGYIAEVIVYERILTEDELVDVNSYLATKYEFDAPACQQFEATTTTTTTTTTTVAPTTTEAPSTTEATTTTEAPATTEAPVTTEPVDAVLPPTGSDSGIAWALAAAFLALGAVLTVGSRRTA